MNTKIFSIMIAFPLFAIDTGQSFPNSSGIDFPDINIPHFIPQTTISITDWNPSESFVTLARGGPRRRCRRIGTSCR